MARTIRVWDLPTRIFHWGLALSVTGLIITGNVGGNAMPWHFRFGYCVLALLLFRIVWGLFGGYWSRFATFIYAPKTILNYLKGRGQPEHSIGHNPLGAFSVFGLLLILAAQVGTGLFSDDEIASTGPLSRFVSGDLVSQLTGYHKGFGKLVIYLLITLHIVAILFYLFKKKENLVRPMVLGDKEVTAELPTSRDSAGTRTAALVVLAACSALAYWVSSLAV